MPSLKDLRGRIASVKATRKITKAMQMVAAAKLRRAQDQAEAARPYSEGLDQILGKFGGKAIPSGPLQLLLQGTGKTQTHLLVVATGERGLAGAFNSNIARLARDHARQLLAEGKSVKIITIGRKGADVLRRDFGKLMIDHIDLRSVRQIGYVHALDIAQRVAKRFEAGEFDVATLFYSQFQNIITQKPKASQLLPVELTATEGNYEFEPDEAEILIDLVPRALATKIFSALLENNAGFYASQMTAMDNATRNAGDMVGRYTLEYNRARQAMITKELIEIISGAEAV
ncbi:F0F1 ATP synthase subunit gamma [Rhodomicrobium lacus]|uniref:F0F1 ATP synthase subunit gamma n=1 Tax=Rhodomicrobium TaxID=1068 RepID=UPI000F8F3496|nr:F0F1 ATP synthase subunit gamma [Rhodomicrobium lacus]WKW50967.1 F0F1 ATP synthase subunit gamma [Rhodomicrobium lacus]